jgi:uncharacterized membrane protein
MGSREGKQALGILIGSVIAIVLILGGLYTYIPAVRPYLFFIYIVVIFGIGFGVCLVINIWDTGKLQKAEKY